MALTLLESLKSSTPALTSAYIETFAENTDLLYYLPFETHSAGVVKYNQEEALPGIGFRKINEGFDESTGVINPVVEECVLAGGDLDVDRALVKRHGKQVLASQAVGKIKNLGHTIAHTMIKGDSATNEKTFDGLQVRLTGSQVISAGSGSGGGALSLEKLDEAIDQTEGANGLMMSLAMKRKITTASRNSTIGGHIHMQLNEFGKQVWMYGELPILIADRPGYVNSSLGFNEAYSGGGTADGTSIYVLGMGDGLLTGVQQSEMEVRNLGELESKPTFRTRVDWDVCMALYHPRCATRLRDIQNAAVVA